MPKPRKIRTLGIDPGKKNTWWSSWEGRRLRDIGELNIPSNIEGLYTGKFEQAINHMFDKAGLEKGDEVIVERFQYRPGFGANSIEIVNHVNACIGLISSQRGFEWYTIQASVHKNAFKKHHTEKFPSAIIKKMAMRTGKWRPRLKRQDPNPHVQDCMTLACWRILRREGKL